ncbi:hypothetical protein scyTo_0019392 [Scyliorhinus torazame]|uniref:Uncharacterized protein n=1 Tax=Scyliorhinus torazame TaxID=75743 RepID=A0A401PYU5_SCYTO|nr:hypothetical protein [Scyliorhinus torazame]
MAAPVSVDGGAEIVVINSRGGESESSVPIVLGAGDEIIVADSGSTGNSNGSSGNIDRQTEIIITDSRDSENATIATIVLNEGDEIIVASSNGAKTETATSIVLSNGTEIKIASFKGNRPPIILKNGLEIMTEHDSEMVAPKRPPAIVEQGLMLGVAEISAPVTATEDTATAGDFDEGADDFAAESLTVPHGPMSVVISLDSSSYTWARWSAWYCNCLNSSMSRIRGILDKETGIVLHYMDYQPSHFQREPCNYKVCECSQEDKQCHLNNVTCLESNPYDCVLNDIAYQEIVDSKHYWKKLKSGAQTLYRRIKTFLSINTNEET